MRNHFLKLDYFPERVSKETLFEEGHDTICLLGELECGQFPSKGVDQSVSVHILDIRRFPVVEQCRFELQCLYRAVGSQCGPQLLLYAIGVALRQVFTKGYAIGLHLLLLIHRLHDQVVATSAGVVQNSVPPFVKIDPSGHYIAPCCCMSVSNVALNDQAHYFGGGAV